MPFPWPSFIRRQWQSATLRSLLNPQSFHAHLQRHRALAERTRSCFSLVLFRVDNEIWDAPPALRFVDVLLGRARVTDLIGWFDKQQIGVVLALTPPAGAVRFIEDVLSRSAAEGAGIQYRIYGFPGDWHTGFGPSGGSEQRDDAAPGSETQAACVAQAAAMEPLLVKQPSHIKRGFDILAAGAGLVVLSPVLLVIAALVKLGSRGPVFFRQARLGLGGRPFQILKFRTMHVSEGAQPHQTHLRRIIRSNSSRVLQKLDHQDRRIIVGGRLLRALGLDELPQLFNVLRGDMSLVGPRPCMPYEAQEFESWQRGRFDVLPGITGLWQVSGKNHTSFKRMMRLDNTYARRPGSIGRDLLIILRTPLTVWSQVRDHFKARGA